MTNGYGTQSVGTDILQGADQIALFLYGDAKLRRRVYHLCEKSQLPHFRLGVLVCARKTTLLDWIENQERRGLLEDA